MSAPFCIPSLRQRVFTALLTVSVLSTGCNSKKPPENAAPENDKVSLFKEGKGILFSAETKKLFSLEITDVTEKPMRRRWQRTAQVYRTGREGISASAMLLLSDEEARELKVGQPVKLQAAEAPEISGTLSRLDTHTQTVLAQIEAVVEFADPVQHCPAGTFVTATFTSGETKTVFVVPESALLTAADGCYVYTVNGSHLTRTRVRPGTVNDGFVEIADGLYAGDSVAAKGVDGLWLVELSALKGGTPCCPVPRKNSDK